MSDPRNIFILARAERFLAPATTIDELPDIRNQARAIVPWIEERGLSEKTIVHEAALKVQAEWKVGELLRSSTLAKGEPGNFTMLGLNHKTPSISKEERQSVHPLRSMA